MNDELNRLYQRICAYSPDAAEGSGAFSQRLARENGWSCEYAARVIEEYKKFIFLAVAAGHPVLPSDQVNQAWMLHLTDTRSYLNDFCEAVVGEPVHHEPSTVSANIESDLRAQYERTKAAYCHLLGTVPPADIWPSAQIRCGDDLHWQRVNCRRSLVLQKPSANQVAVAGVGLMLLLAACFCGQSCNLSPVAGNAPSPQHEILIPMNMPTHAIADSSVELRKLADQPHFVVHPNSPHVQVVAAAIPEQLSSADYLLPRDKRWSESRQRQKVIGGMGISLGAVLVISLVYLALKGGQCAACGKMYAMRKAGTALSAETLLAGVNYEWKCKYCGATKWQASSSGGNGGE